MWSMLEQLAPTIVPIIILFFEVLGIFGNVSLIVATIRNDVLHTKHGILLALTSFYQLMCLLGELINVGFALKGGEIKRNMCFAFMGPYVVFSCLQSSMYLVLATDILVSLTFPLRHITARTSTYVCIASLLPVSYAVLILTMATLKIMHADANPTILLCNPPLAIDAEVCKFWINWNGLSNFVVFLAYATIHALIRRREKRQLTKIVQLQAQRKSFYSLLWLIAVFASTWCTSMFTMMVMSWFPPSKEIAVVQSYVVIFVLMAISANYYVYMAKNLTYRRIFIEQLRWMLPKSFQWVAQWPCWSNAAINPQIVLTTAAYSTSRTENKENF